MTDSPLKFPCDIAMKIMGLNEPSFKTTMLAIVYKHYPNLKEKAISCKLSKGDKFLSLTVMIQAQSKVEIDALYEDVSKHELALFVL